MKVYSLLHYYKVEDGYKSLLVSTHATKESVELEKIAQNILYSGDSDWLSKDHWFDVREMELLG